jgi:hypothetical protein
VKAAALSHTITYASADDVFKNVKGVLLAEIAFINQPQASLMHCKERLKEVCL